MNSKLQDQNYYEILEVSPNAAPHEIQKAFLKAKETYSPNSPALYSMFTQEEARDLLILIDEAYSVVGNPAKRKAYDQELQNARHSTGSPQKPQAANLPDFEAPQENPEPAPEKKSHQTVQSVSTPAPAPGGKLPNGYARTRFSVYEVNSSIEDEIKNQNVFDGTFLQKVRQYKNISLDQLSNETRISRTYLAAMEANKYDALPAPVFVRGFVVQAARVLGLKEQQVASSYMEVLKKGRPG